LGGGTFSANQAESAPLKEPVVNLSNRLLNFSVNLTGSYSFDSATRAYALFESFDLSVLVGSFSLSVLLFLPRG
jgi:hypothetical protein